MILVKETGGERGARIRGYKKRGGGQENQEGMEIEGYRDGKIRSLREVFRKRLKSMENL